MMNQGNWRKRGVIYPHLMICEIKRSVKIVSRMATLIDEVKFDRICRKHNRDRVPVKTHVFYIPQYGQVYGCHICEGAQFVSYKGVYAHFVAQHIELRPVCYNRYFNNPAAWAWKDHHVAMADTKPEEVVTIRPRTRPADTRAPHTMSSGNPALGLRAAPTVPSGQS